MIDSLATPEELCKQLNESWKLVVDAIRECVCKDFVLYLGPNPHNAGKYEYLGWFRDDRHHIQYIDSLLKPANQPGTIGTLAEYIKENQSQFRFRSVFECSLELRVRMAQHAAAMIDQARKLPLDPVLDIPKAIAQLTQAIRT